VKRQQTGKLGERLALEYLQKEGYTIATTNWHCAEGEIDIVAQKNGETIFVEVRAKSSSEFGTPAESVTRRKQEKLIATAERYISETAESGEWRIDFIGIEFTSSGSRLEHIPNAVGSL
jgi:putative endonuclease